MSEQRCPGCGGIFRAGKLAYVAVEGTMLRKRVCRPCARSAVHIITPTMQTTACKLCGSRASYCEEHRSRATDYATIDRALARLLMQIEVSLRAARASTDEGISVFASEMLQRKAGVEAARALVRDIAEGRPI